MSSPPQCRKCAREFERPNSAGRAPAYCSTGCRRAMEYETRRLQAALAEIEDQLRWCRLGWNGRRGSDTPKYDVERLRLEERLRELLDEPGPDPPEEVPH